MKKRIFISLLAVVFVMMMLPGAALAHGHGVNRSTVNANNYELCPFADCDLAHLHRHDSCYYAGHSVGDGHNYHQVCPVEECPLIGSHEHTNTANVPNNNYELCPFADCDLAHLHRHDNCYYAGHSVGDGHNHHQICPVEECPLIGSHEHIRAANSPNNNAGGSGNHNNRHGGNRRHH